MLLLKKTAGKTAKYHGLNGLKEITELTGQSVETLRNWFLKKPLLFHVVLVGCLMLRDCKKASVVSGCLELREGGQNEI